MSMGWVNFYCWTCFATGLIVGALGMLFFIAWRIDRGQT